MMRRTTNMVIPAAQVRVNPQSVMITDQIPAAKSTVELVKQGDCVTGLKVRCACGREIFAECQYDDKGQRS